MLTPFPVWWPPRWNGRVEGLILRRAKQFQRGNVRAPPLFFMLAAGVRFFFTVCMFVFVIVHNTFYYQSMYSSWFSVLYCRCLANPLRVTSVSR